MSDFGPLILLFLFGGFAVFSALVKFRARITAAVAVVFAVLEGLAGLALMTVSTPTSGSLRTASAAGIATAVLVCISSTIHLVNVRKRRRARDASQEKRLYQSIKYGIGASGTPTPEGDVEGTAEAAVEAVGEAAVEAVGEAAVEAVGEAAVEAVGEAAATEGDATEGDAKVEAS